MIPMGLSFLFLGVGFGLYATSQGFPWWTAPVLASTIFAGSMEFVTIGLLMAGFDPVNTFMLTLFVNGRHFFYGLSALQRYVHMGWKWFPTVAWMVLYYLAYLLLYSLKCYLMLKVIIFEA